MRTKFACVIGTRPEAIKLAPLIWAARERPAEFEPVIINTGQHVELLDPLFARFGFAPDFALHAMKAGRSLAELTSVILTDLSAVLAQCRPDAVVVQGDTTSAMCGALAGFYQRIPVAHVEAGLRTDDIYAPFPEEVNRRFISQVARWHFAPTTTARAALRREHLPLPGATVHVTGNTGIDTLLRVASRGAAVTPADPDLAAVTHWLGARAGRRVILVTAHRRENFGDRFEQLCAALRALVDEFTDCLVVFPLHLNPSVREPARARLGGHPRIRLIEPKEYHVFVELMNHSCLIITDSGGVQEEAPCLGKPVFVVRDTTERPEAVATGVVMLVGSDRDRIAREVGAVLRDPVAHARMARRVMVYGDGRAAERCLAALRGEVVTEFGSGAVP